MLVEKSNVIYYNPHDDPFIEQYSHYNETIFMTMEEFDRLPFDNAGYRILPNRRHVRIVVLGFNYDDDETKVIVGVYDPGKKKKFMKEKFKIETIQMITMDRLVI